jgi:very-short-patch-repair endonuclease
MKKVVSYDKFFSDEEKEEIRKDYLDNLLSLSEIRKKYNIGSKNWLDKLIGKDKRNVSERIKILRERHPEYFKRTNEVRDKIRLAHIKWLKENSGKTAWRLKNMSYPEKCFQKMLEDNGIDKKYLIYREYSVFPFYIDFAFVDEKVAVEIDGSQHLDEERKKKDEEKDKLLLSKGWRILRITANEVIKNNNEVIESVISMLGNTETKYTKVGILKAPKRDRYKKVIRGKDGLTDKERLRAIKQRRVERPDKEELSKELAEKSFSEVGRIYGVSDNAIRRWCKWYGLPHRKKDINKMI